MPSFMKSLMLGVAVAAVFAVKYSDARPAEGMTTLEDESVPADMEDLAGLLAEYEGLESRARRSVDGWEAEHVYGPTHPFDDLIDANEEEQAKALFREPRATMEQAPPMGTQGDVDEGSAPSRGKGKKKRGKGKGRGREGGTATQDGENNN